MSPSREVVDRLGRRFPDMDDPFERLVRRRDRKRRNQRIGAGVVAVLIALAAAGAFARAITFHGGPADEPIPTVTVTPSIEPLPLDEGVFSVTLGQDACTIEGREGPVDTNKIRFNLWTSTGDYPVTFDIGRISPEATYSDLVTFIDDQRAAGVAGIHRPSFFEAPLRGYSLLGGSTGHFFAKSLVTLDDRTGAGYWQSWWRADHGPVPAGTYAVVCYRGENREPVGVAGPVVVRQRAATG
jgi:hypothetical protein